MLVINVTNARKDLYNLIQKVNENSEPVLITGKECNAVLISEGDWKSICETMRLKSIPGMEEPLMKGKKSSLSDCFTNKKIEKMAEAVHGVAVMCSLPEEQREYIRSLINRAVNGDVFVQILLRRWKNKKYDEKDQIAHPVFFELPEEAKEVLYKAILDLKKERDYATWVRKD